MKSTAFRTTRRASLSPLLPSRENQRAAAWASKIDGLFVRENVHVRERVLPQMLLGFHVRTPVNNHPQRLGTFASGRERASWQQTYRLNSISRLTFETNDRIVGVVD